ncbi:MAG: 3'(2'),5'-bisphosphate nucleotidase CysQ [Alphaproteobacteria bacterium]|nr:3'(2'),5'-bisphosphate nucleotidase CysQ [Alphaproteobacteria bacterium]
MTLSLPSFWSPRHAAALQDLARQAGASIMAHRAAATAPAEHKTDGSPVTAADRDSQRIIIEGLRALTPGIPAVAEEKDNPAALAANGTYWLVDPLDGTRDYVAGGQEFSVNIGLLVGNEPCIGVIFAPAVDDLFYGDPTGVERMTPQGKRAFKAGSYAKSNKPPRLLTSRHEAKRLPINEWLEGGQISAWRPCSSGYKFGLLVSGEDDLYPRAGATCEWDTAAGDAILRAVGGRIVTRGGKTLAYGKPDFLNSDFIACGPTYDDGALPGFLALLEECKKP